MTKLIDELKKDHETITETLQKVKESGIGSTQAQSILMSAKGVLLEHLKKEDAELYPVLEKSAINDEKLRNDLDIFAQDMDKVSSAALEFFDKYTSGGDSIEFASDYGKLVATLVSRIRREESILYKRYNELSDT